jgi:hypothetical protein
MLIRDIIEYSGQTEPPIQAETEPVIPAQTEPPQVYDFWSLAKVLKLFFRGIFSHGFTE